jgi:two-component system, NarL family, sensor kinase
LNTSQQRLADEKLKAMAQRIVLLQEEERAYVSRHLHDGVSQVLVAAKLQLESAARALAAGPGSPPELALGLEQLSEAIVAVRDVSHELRPLELDRLGLSGALRQLADEFAARSGLSVSFEDGSEGARLGDQASVALFRVVQEALTNVARHARATHVDVRLSKRGAELCLSLVDDGGGFDVVQVARSPRGGIGLRNVRERVEHLGGHFNVRSRPGHTELEVRLPTSPRQS